MNVVEEKEEGRVVTRLYAIKAHGVHHSVRDTATYTRDYAGPGAPAMMAVSQRQQTIVINTLHTKMSV